MKSPSLIGTAEAAQLLGIDRSTLVRRVASGQLSPAYKLPSSTGAYLFDADDIASRAGAAA